LGHTNLTFTVLITDTDIYNIHLNLHSTQLANNIKAFSSITLFQSVQLLSAIIKCEIMLLKSKINTKKNVQTLFSEIDNLK